MNEMIIQTPPDEITNADAVPVIFQVSNMLMAPGNGAWVKFPRECQSVGVVLSSTGDGRIEVTLASYAEIDGNVAPAHSIMSWPAGNIGIAQKEAIVNRCTAFRQVNIAGVTIMSAVGR